MLEGLNAQLTAVYKATLDRLASDAQKGDFTVATANGMETSHPVDDLSAAEQAFVGYRTRMCKTAYDVYFQGTIRDAQFLFCEIDLTRAQISEVKSLGY